MRFYILLGILFDSTLMCSSFFLMNDYCWNWLMPYGIGHEIPTYDHCMTCHCEYDMNFHAIETCHPIECNCPVETIDDGSCCGICPGPEHMFCEMDGEIYNIGEEVQGTGPCETCHCIGSQHGAEFHCENLPCPLCAGHIVEDGSCCGRCEPLPVGCMDNGQHYGIDENIPSTDPCEICTCTSLFFGWAEVMCHRMTCDLHCDGGVHVDDGTCCGHCDVADTTPVSVCDVSQCPVLKCSEDLQVHNDGECCPQCRCQKKKNVYEPGETVGDKCDGCTCDGVSGNITCVVPECPHPVHCVDPVKEDCCYTCPNGTTCALVNNVKTVIRLGEYKWIGKKVCTCAGNPWFPNAFCAPKKVKTSKFKPVAKYFSPYMKKP